MTWDPPTDEPLARLEALVERLRAPDGCPWDREQELGDLRAYLLEEAHELAAAIDTRDWSEIASELGDLLFHVAFIGRLAAEAGAFRLADAARLNEEKMVARHPHVFGDLELADSAAVERSWEEGKARTASGSHLGGVASSLPALLAAYRMTQKAAGVGFDWDSPAEVLEKVDEELDELAAALDPKAGDGGTESEAVGEELGDLLFTVANLARKLGHDPEAALAAANAKFRRRFEAIEAALAADGRTLADAERPEMERLWQRAKAAERG